MAVFDVGKSTSDIIVKNKAKLHVVTTLIQTLHLSEHALVPACSDNWLSTVDVPCVTERSLFHFPMILLLIRSSRSFHMCNINFPLLVYVISLFLDFPLVIILISLFLDCLQLISIFWSLTGSEVDLKSHGDSHHPPPLLSLHTWLPVGHGQLLAVIAIDKPFTSYHPKNLILATIQHLATV